MYDDIWNQPHSELGKWSRVKKVHISDGPPAGSDITIFSTIIHLQSQYDHVLFLTNDHDFICFKDVISRRFKIELESIWD